MSLPWSSKGLKVTPVGADEVMLLDSEDANPSTQNKRATITSIGSLVSGEANTSSNSGAGFGWAQAKTGVDLPFKSFITNLPLVITSNTNDLTLDLNPIVNADISATALIEFSKLEDLTDGNIVVGSNINKISGVPLSGDATITNTGILTIGNNIITDAKIATHTTTKITTDNKSLLNPNIVYIDQTNTFGAFAQRFPNNQLQVANPAATFNYSFVSSAITANRNVIFPALTNNDTFVFVTETQTLANKTLTQPTITDYTNAVHDHSNVIGGGQLTNTALTPGVFSAITGLGAQSQVLDMNTFTITDLPLPLNDTEAASKLYVDQLIEGLAWKDPAQLATIGDITLSGEQSIDGVLTSASRVLVKDQTDASENGVYDSDAGAWTRTTDADSEADLLNMSIFIQQGTVNDDTSWVLVTDAPIVVDTTDLNYVQVSGGFSSPLTTKGDILGYDIGDNRIPVGTNGQVLTANSAVALGVEWAAVGSTFQTPWGQDIDAAGFDLFNIPTITFDNSAEPATPAAGELIMWSESLLGSQVLRYKGDNGIAQTIVENNVAVVRNDTGVTISKGDAVYIDGESASKISVALAKADVNSTVPAVGVAQEDIANAADGFILSRGILVDVDTSSFTAGDVLYLSDSTAGELTTTQPVHPSLSQVMGVVTSVNASTGTIQITTSQVTGAETGTNENSFDIGDALAGTKSLVFTNDFTGALEWTPTAARTLILPDVTDTLIGKATTDVFTNKSLDADGTGNVITNIGSSEIKSEIITGQTLKGTPVAADEILISDSADSGNLKRTTLTDLIGGAGEVFTWTADHSMATFKLTASPANNVILNAPTGEATLLQVNGATEYTFSAGGANWLSNILLGMGVLSFDDVNTSIQQNATNLELDVATGGSQVFRINDATEYSFGATEANWFANDLINVGLLNLKIDNTTALMELEANHSTPANGLIIGNIDFVDDDSLGAREVYARIQGEILDPSSATPNGTLSMQVAVNGTLDDFIVMNTSTNIITIPKQTIFGDIVNFSSGEFAIQVIGNFMTYDTFVGTGHNFRIDEVVEYEFGVTEADFNGNNLNLNGGLIQFDDANTSITQSAVSLLYDVATGGTHAFRINDNPEYSFNATELNLNNNNLTTVGFLDFGAGSANAGTIRLPNAATIEWEASPAANNPFITVDASEEFFISNPNNLQTTPVVLNLKTTTPLSGNNPRAEIHFLGNSDFNYAEINVAESSNSAGSLTIRVASGALSDYMIFNRNDNGTIRFSKELDIFSNNITDVGFIDFGTGSADAGTIRLPNIASIEWERNPSGTNSSISHDINEIIKIFSGSGNSSDFSAGSFVPQKPIIMGTFALQFQSGGSSLQGVGNNIQYDVPNTFNHQFRVNDVTEYQFDATEADFLGNDLINVGLLNLKIDDTTANLELEANHTVPANGQGIGNINFIDDDSSGNRETYARISSFIQSPTNTSEEGELHFDIAIGGTLTNIIEMNPGFATAPITFKTDVAFNGTLFFNNSNSSIGLVTSNLTYDVLTGQTHDFRVNDVVEYSYSATEADFLGNDLRNIGFFESDAAIPATAGTGRFGNDQVLAWRDSSNLTDATFGLNSGDHFEFNGQKSIQITPEAESGGDIFVVTDYAVPADGDSLGVMFWEGADSVASPIIWAEIEVRTEDVTSTVSSGSMTFNLKHPDNTPGLDDFLTLGVLPAGTKAGVHVGEPLFLMSAFQPNDDDDPYIVNDGGPLLYNVQSGENHKFLVQGSNALVINATNIGLESGSEIQWAENTNRRIFNNGTGFIFEVASGDNFDYQINSVSEYTFSSTEFDVVGNDINNIQNLIHDLSTSGTDVDFGEDELQEISISTNTTFTGTGYATGKSKVVKITTDGTLRTLAFPAGWTFVGAKPADQAASKEGILTLTCFGGAEANVIAAYAVEE